MKYNTNHCETIKLNFKALNNYESVSFVILDISKTKDCLNNDILLKKEFENTGIRGEILEWFKSYLTGRRQAIIIVYIKYSTMTLTQTTSLA